MAIQVATFQAIPAGLSLHVKKLRHRRRWDLFNVIGGTDDRAKFKAGSIPYDSGVLIGIVDDSVNPSPGWDTATTLRGTLTFDVGTAGTNGQKFSAIVYLFDIVTEFDFEKPGSSIMVTAAWQIEGTTALAAIITNLVA